MAFDTLYEAAGDDILEQILNPLLEELQEEGASALGKQKKHEWTENKH